MKKKDQYYHPRLYISVSKDSYRLYSVKYYGNKINKYGNRLLIANNENLSNQIADSDDTLLSLNKKEYLNLILYMKKQEKVLVLYRKKNKIEKIKIIENSVKVAVEFKSLFKNWFNKNNINIDLLAND